MSDPFIGEIRMFAGNFAPRGWALCNGQTLPISQNSALFAILGTTFGGNGTTNFALPNLQGAVPMQWGTGRTGTAYTLGQNGGAETVPLQVNQLPPHTHGVAASAAATTSHPSGAVPASFPAPRGAAATNIYAAAPDGTTMNPQMIATTGGGQPHSNMQPFVCVTFIIATQGLFPSQN